MENKENVLKEVEEITARVRGLKEEDLKMRHYPILYNTRETQREVLARELKELAKREGVMIEFRNKECILRFKKDGEITWDSANWLYNWPGWIVDKDCEIDSIFHGQGPAARLLRDAICSPQEIKRIEVI